MAKTGGGHSASPSSPRPPPQRAAMGAAPSPPVQAPAIPPSEGEVPSQRRYPTRRPPTDPVPSAEQAASSVSRPPAKRSRFSGPGEPSHAPQPEPATEEPRIPVDMPPETVIRSAPSEPLVRMRRACQLSETIPEEETGEPSHDPLISDIFIFYLLLY
ncbi:hypothetical protein AAG906_027291 [Vitis piasezkii]